MNRLDVARVLSVVGEARREAWILMGHGDGKIKRQLGLVGEYKKHKEKAFGSVVDNALYLSIALDVIEHPVLPLGWFLKMLLKGRMKKFDRELDAAFVPKDTKALNPKVKVDLKDVRGRT